MTSDSTKITLNNCQANAGGKPVGSLPLQSVKVTLKRGNATIASKTQKCGTYDFGQVAVGEYKFEITAINGNTANRETFLNSDPVTVSY